MPKGTLRREADCTFRKFTKIPCAVSGLRYTTADESSTGPTNVLNIRLNLRDSVKLPLVPHDGQGTRLSRDGS